MRVSLYFVLIAIVVCALVNPGNFGTIDTARRWQVARWMRLGEPPVPPDDARLGFGIRGRNGVMHAWYGMGQSLVILPFDALVDTALRAPGLGGLDPLRRKQVAGLAIAFLMQAFLTAWVLILARRVLLDLGFAEYAAVCGALALLFATTLLQYVQCAQENELLLTLDLSALAAIGAYRRDARLLWAAAAGAACGFAILVRVTSSLDAALFGVFAVATGASARRFLAPYAAPVAAALLLDRWYQWHRFGELFSTYLEIFARQTRTAATPASYPFSYPFWKGFLGTFFSPDKSVFLFDPLLAAAVLLVMLHWKSLGRALRVLFVCLVLLLMGYAVAFARYYGFGGEVAWGHRFVVVPVELIAMFAVPLLLRGRWRALWAVAIVSVVLQAASTVIWPNVEIIQRERGSARSVIWNRAVNLGQLATGHEDPARFAGVPPEWRTLTYLPFQLRLRFPHLAVWAIAGWLALLLSLPVLIAMLCLQARTP